MRVQNISRNKRNKNASNTDDSVVVEDKSENISKDENTLPIYSSNYNSNISIDSIHITSTLNPFDIEKEEKIYIDILDEVLSSERNFRVDLKSKEDAYIKKYMIYYDNQQLIKVTSYSNKGRKYIYEFGGLSQYTKLHPTLIHILRSVYKEIVSINEIHLSYDIFARYEDIIVKPTIRYSPKGFQNGQGKYFNLYYSKGKKCTLNFYNKSYQAYQEKNFDISYQHITRLELKLYNAFLSNRKFKKLLNSEDTNNLDKFETIVCKLYTDFNISHKDGMIDFTTLKVKEVVENFIEFLESDLREVPLVNDKFPNYIKQQQIIIDKIKKAYSLKRIQDLLKLLDTKQTNKSRIHEKTNIQRGTINKIITFLRELS